MKDPDRRLNPPGSFSVGGSRPTAQRWATAKTSTISEGRSADQPTPVTNEVGVERDLKQIQLPPTHEEGDYDHLREPKDHHSEVEDAPYLRAQGVV
jgi:hypothetical protein